MCGGVLVVWVGGGAGGGDALCEPFLGRARGHLGSHQSGGGVSRRHAAGCCGVHLPCLPPATPPTFASKRAAAAAWRLNHTPFVFPQCCRLLPQALQIMMMLLKDSNSAALGYKMGGGGGGGGDESGKGGTHIEISHTNKQKNWLRAEPSNQTDRAEGKADKVSSALLALLKWGYRQGMAEPSRCEKRERSNYRALSSLALIA